MILNVGHHLGSTGRVYRPLSILFHGRMAEDVDLVMQDPSQRAIEKLGSLGPSTNPSVLHEVL